MRNVAHIRKINRKSLRWFGVLVLASLLVTGLAAGPELGLAAGLGTQPAPASRAAQGGQQGALPAAGQAAGRAPSLTLSVVALDLHNAYLSWTVPAGTEPTGFNITRNGKPLTTLGGSERSYADANLSQSTSYVYVLEAIVPSGAPRLRAKPVQIKTPGPPDTPDTTPPSEPELMEATPGDGWVGLAWDASTDDTDISAYIIRRDNRQLAIVNSGTQLYFDTDVQPQTTYQYTLEAVDVIGHHSRQNGPVSVTTGNFTGPASSGSGSSPALPQSGATTSTSGASLAATTIGGYTAQLRRYPYLTDVVNNADTGYATVNWASDQSASTGSVQWGQVGTESCTAHTTAATRTTISVNSVNEYQWKAMLTLAPGVEYCYRVFLGGTDLLGSDPAPHFFTQVPAGPSAPFSFAVLGDWGYVDGNGVNPDQANLMGQLAQSGARFALTTGDNSYPSGSQANYGDLVQTGSSLSAVFGPQFWARVGASVPLFPAIGNHGLSRSDTSHPHLLNWPQDRAVATSGGRYQRDTYCCLNGTTSAVYPSTWYAFDAGNARFYVLQAAWADGNVGTTNVYNNDYSYQWTPAQAQYQWLANDLATHPAALKFAFFHYPLYSDNKAESSDTYLQGAGSLEGLLANSSGTTIVFNGHAHLYERNRVLQPPLLPSYVTGGGGAQLQRMDAGCGAYDAYALGWSYTKNQGYACGPAAAPASTGQVVHFVLATVNDTSVTVNGVNSEGTVFDTQTYPYTPLATPTPTATPTATGTPLPATPTPTETPPPATSTPTGTPPPATPTPTGTPPPATPTPTPSSTTPPPVTPVFQDGFESGNLSAWTTYSGLTMQGGVVHTGNFAAEGNTTNGATYAKKVLASTYTDAYARTYFNLVSFASQVNLLRFRTSTDGSIAYLGVSTTGKLLLRNDAGAVTVNSATGVSAGSGWHALEFHAVINGAASTTEVWLDGVKVNDLSVTTNLGSTAIGRVQIGEVNTGRTYDVVFDDVVFSTGPIGP